MSKYKGFNYIKRLILIVLLGFIFVSIFAKKVNIQTESKINEENLYLFTGIGSNEINELIFTPIVKITKNGYKKLTAKQIVENKNSIFIKLKKKNAKEIKSSYEELARNTDWEYRFKFINIKGYDDFVNGISKEIDGIRVVSDDEIEFDVYNTDDLSFLTIPNIHTDYKGFKLGDKYVFQNGLNTITIEDKINNKKGNFTKYQSKETNHVLYKYVGYIGIKDENEEKRNKIKHILSGKNENVDYIDFVSDGSKESVENFDENQYAITKYFVNNGKDDSSLMKVASASEIKKPDQYKDMIIISKEKTKEEQNTNLFKEIINKLFNIVEAVEIENYDGGVSQFENNGSIKGKVWLDGNRDSIKDEDENEGIPEIELQLEQYKLVNGNFEFVKVYDKFIITESGEFEFKNLPLFSINKDGKKEMLGYKIKATDTGSYGISEWKDDNKLNEETKYIGDIIIVANDKNINNDLYEFEYDGVKYNFVKGVERDGYYAGLYRNNGERPYVDINKKNNDPKNNTLNSNENPNNNHGNKKEDITIVKVGDIIIKYNEDSMKDNISKLSKIILPKTGDIMTIYPYVIFIISIAGIAIILTKKKKEEG